MKYQMPGNTFSIDLPIGHAKTHFGPWTLDLAVWRAQCIYFSRNLMSVSVSASIHLLDEPQHWLFQWSNNNNMFPLPQQAFNHSPRLVAQGIICCCVFHVWFCMLVIYFAYSSHLAGTEHRTQLSRHCIGQGESHLEFILACTKMNLAYNDSGLRDRVK